jgi:hypothetical protein
VCNSFSGDDNPAGFVICRGIFRWIQNYFAGYKEMTSPDDFIRQHEKARAKLAHGTDDYTVAPQTCNTLDVWPVTRMPCPALLPFA